MGQRLDLYGNPARSPPERAVESPSKTPYLDLSTLGLLTSRRGFTNLRSIPQRSHLDIASGKCLMLCLGEVLMEKRKGGIYGQET